MSEKEKLLNNIDIQVKRIDNIRNIVLKYNDDFVSNVDKVLIYLNKLHDKIIKDNIPERYYKVLDIDIVNVKNIFRLDENLINEKFCEENNISSDTINHLIVTSINEEVILRNVEPLLFKLDFFEKLDFFNTNLVIVGANGSGKTTLSNELKKSIEIKQGVVISAQRVLIIPTFGAISDSKQTKQKLSKIQSKVRDSKITFNTENNGNSYSIMHEIGDEFMALLNNLLAERSYIRNQHCDKMNQGIVSGAAPKTNLDKAIKLWNFLIEHREITCDGVNFYLSGNNIEQYEAYKMSDGEKVILYFISQVLQAPENGFIIIDEPEMYLHKTILNKLWDLLEQERKDCLFAYLTHDLEFASSRNAKKIWIKSFIFPDKWEFEPLPENVIPEELLMKLLGSSKPILFCEGKVRGSIDVKIYNILFSNLTIIPVETCKDVINYTKAYNKIENKTKSAVGIIDSDFRTQEEIDILKNNSIYTLPFSEVENLLLNEVFLRAFAKKILTDEKIIASIKDKIVAKLEQDIELQVSNYLSAKINHFFTFSHVEKGNTISEVNSKFEDFQSQIKIHEWYKERKVEIQKIISDKNYTKVLQIYNNKGLFQIVGQSLSIGDFKERAIRFLIESEDMKNEIRKAFPCDLLSNL